MSAPVVLLVEDSDTQALLFSDRLRREGYEVRRVASAESALESLNGHLPDLIVADYHLPGMDGGEFARQIRLNRRTRSLGLLMMTAASGDEVEREGLASGVDAYVAKSAGYDLILARVRALLRRRPSPQEADGALFRRAKIAVLYASLDEGHRLGARLEAEGYEIVGCPLQDGLPIRPATLSAEAASAAASSQEVADGEECLADIDCYLVPTALGPAGGAQAVRRLDALRAADPNLNFALVMVDADPADALSAYEAGADEVVPREAADSVLRDRVRALMRRKLAAEEARQAAAEAGEQAQLRARAEAADALAAANRRLGEVQVQLVQAAKMASLGELVAGLAHEINNPLSFIIAHQNTVDRLIGQALADPAGAKPKLAKARDRLGAMNTGLERIRDLVVNLRRFSRLDSADRQTIDVRQALETVIALLKPKLGSIETVLQVEDEQFMEGSPALFNQVVMNLVSNAADALGGEGRIRIVSSRRGGERVIKVEDDGPGVPEELRERIFDPFFTTKPAGAGTGLGLAIAYNVAIAHGGALTLEDSALGGAGFTLRLPEDAST